MVLKIWKKYGHVATCLNFDFCPHDPTYMALQGQNLRNSWPKKSLQSIWQIMGSFFWQKRREVATVVCVWHGYRSKFPSTHSHTHKTMATPLLLCYLPMICQTTLGSIFNFFEGVNEGNLKKWSEGNHNWACRIDLDFFVWWVFMQNRDFRASKGPFLGQKTKTSVRRRY